MNSLQLFLDEFWKIVKLVKGLVLGPNPPIIKLFPQKILPTGMQIIYDLKYMGYVARFGIIFTI